MVVLAVLLPLLNVCLSMAVVEGANDEYVSNASFEEVNLDVNSTAYLLQNRNVDLGLGSATLPGWTIGGGGAWLYTNTTGNMTVAAGNYALLLALDQGGNITQTLSLVEGKTYDLSYATVGAGFGCQGTISYEVTAGDLSKSFSFTSSMSDGTAGPFSLVSFSFVGSSQTELTFNTTSISGPSSFCGVVLDAITVHARPDAVTQPGNLVTNGDFEGMQPFPADLNWYGYTTYIQIRGKDPVLGWGAARPTTGIYVLRSTDTSAALNGRYSLGFSQFPIGISQPISTIVGHRYRLTFTASSYFECPETFSLTAYLGPLSKYLSLPSGDRNASFSMEADAFSSPTTLAIFSQTATTDSTRNLCGPLIDDIVVQDIGNATRTQNSTAAFGNFTGLPEEISVNMGAFVNGSEMVLLGSPKVQGSASEGFTLRLTGQSRPESGRALFKDPLRLFDRRNGRAASFNTNFTFRMNYSSDNGLVGDKGFVFLFVPDNKEPGRQGASMAFEYPATNEFRTPTFGVEFDSYQDMQYGDINGDYEGTDVDNLAHHIGVNVETAASLIAVELKRPMSPAWLNNGELRYVSINFDNITQTLKVWLSDSQLTADDIPLLTASIDLNTLLDPAEWFYVGFSASTDINLQSHEILSWTFTSSIVKSTRAPVSSVPGTAPPPPAPKGKGGKNNAGIIGGTIGAVLFFLAVVACAAAVCVFRQRRKKENADDVPVAPTGDIRKSSSEALGINMGPQPFTFPELQAATSNFATKLGEGGQGSVFLGTLPDNEVVAVKVIDIEKNAKGGERAFRAEASTLGSLRHRNLCRFVGWCVDFEESKLMCCYEYMRNGSLDMWLFLPRQLGGQATHTLKPPLLWPHRYGIAAGLARALAYLHDDAEKKIVHRDVKPGNILLDETFNARLGDFGLAFSVSHEASTIDTRTAAGTSIYMPPESRFGVKPSEKWDIYAFGLVMLELVSGRRAMETTYPSNEIVLLMYTWQLVEEGHPLDIQDARLQGEYDDVQMMKLIHVGLACTSPNPQQRPSMRHVIQALDAEGSSILPIVAPTTRPPELVVPDYVSNTSSSWTRESGEPSNSDKRGTSQSSC